jgi:hypothetical protein
VNEGGLDRGVVQFYHGQNGGGLKPGIMRAQWLGEPIPSTTYSVDDFILPGHGQYDIGVTAGFIGGGTIGVQFGNNGKFFFLGYGYDFGPPVSASVMVSNQSVQPGWQTSVQGTFSNGSAGQLSFDENGFSGSGAGVGYPPGGSIMHSYTFGPW